MEPVVETGQSGVKVVSAVAKPEASLRYCLLEIGQESFAIDFNQVREVFRVESITPVPGVPSVLVGVANLRGTVIPLADLRVFMGVSRSSKPKYAAIVRQDGKQIGILIDGVPEVHRLDIEKLPETMRQDQVPSLSFLLGSARREGKTVSVVDIAKLVTAVENTADQQGTDS